MFHQRFVQAQQKKHDPIPVKATASSIAAATEAPSTASAPPAAGDAQLAAAQLHRAAYLPPTAPRATTPRRSGTPRKLTPVEIITIGLAFLAGVLFLWDMLVRAPASVAAAARNAPTTIEGQLRVLDAADDPKELALADGVAEAALCVTPLFDVVMVLGGGTTSLHAICQFLCVLYIHT